jgi:hypothetical protein
MDRYEGKDQLVQAAVDLMMWWKTYDNSSPVDHGDLTDRIIAIAKEVIKTTAEGEAEFSGAGCSSNQPPA